MFGHRGSVPSLHRPCQSLLGTHLEKMGQIGFHQGANASRASRWENPQPRNSATLS